MPRRKTQAPEVPGLIAAKPVKVVVLGEGEIQVDPADILYQWQSADQSDGQDTYFLWHRMRFLGDRTFTPFCIRAAGNGMLYVSRFVPAS